VVSGGVTALTHDPAASGPLGLVERLGAGFVDGAWSWAGGPLAAADALTGGNGSGLLKSGVSAPLAVIDAIARGDSKPLGKMADNLENGNYGRAAQGLAQAGGAMGEGIYDAGDNYSLTSDARQAQRDTEREMVKNGQMSRDEYVTKWNAQ
jgi:hypothetical protein